MDWLEAKRAIRGFAQRTPKKDRYFRRVVSGIIFLLAALSLALTIRITPGLYVMAQELHAADHFILSGEWKLTDDPLESNGLAKWHAIGALTPLLVTSVCLGFSAFMFMRSLTANR